MIDATYFPELEIVGISPKYVAGRPTKGYKEDPLKLFTDIHSLVFFLTSRCNFAWCDHCAVDEVNHLDTSNQMSVMAPGLVIGLLNLMQDKGMPIGHTTNSGGEVTLLDKRIRDWARENSLITPGFAALQEGHDYLPELVSHQLEIATLGEAKLSRARPCMSNNDGKVRISTNGILFPWLEDVSLNDDSAIRESALYSALSAYPGVLFSISIGPFQQVKYLALANRLKENNHPLGDSLALERRIDELFAVQRVLSKSSSAHYFEIEFMFTYFSPYSSAITWGEIESYFSSKYPSLSSVPAHNPGLNQVYQHVVNKYGAQPELQPVLSVGHATKERLANHNFRTESRKGLPETDQLFLVPDKDGVTLHAYENPVDMYGNIPSRRMFSLRFH